MSRGKKLSQLHMLTESFGLALHHVPYERLVHPITRVVYVQLSVWMDCLQKNTFAGKFKPTKITHGRKLVDICKESNNNRFCS